MAGHVWNLVFDFVFRNDHLSKAQNIRDVAQQMPLDVCVETDSLSGTCASYRGRE
jgi:hypothetical protein